jgi:hypothetical protein
MQHGTMHGLPRMIEAIYEAIRQGTPPPFSREDMLATARLTDRLVATGELPRVRVLITGAGGFLGRATLAFGACAGHEVIAMHRPASPVASGDAEPRLTWISAICDSLATGAPRLRP